MWRGRTAMAALVATALYCASAWPQAPSTPAEPSTAWLDKRFGYVANNESLRSLLYDFGTTLGVPVVVSNAINVIADGEVPVMPAEGFLAEVHARFGLIWVYDGTMLYLYDGAEAATETVAFPTARRDAFQAAIEDAGVRGVPLAWVFLPAENALQLSGPPRFVQWAADLADGIVATTGTGTAAGDAELVIRIFEVEHGYADGAAAGEHGSAMAGLAEMIAKLMNVGHVSAPVVPANADPGGVPKLRGSGVIADTAPAAAPPASVVAARDAGHEAFVVGDPRLNAIIVRDRAERMPDYERLIAELDRPVDQIEIAVTVLDIDSSAADELRFSLAAGGVELDAGAEGGTTIRYAEDSPDADGIAVRIRALHSAGKSRVLTRPSVTTLDNHEASFRNNRTFYVRLGGSDAEAVDLAPVSYGWVVRIRPHIAYADDHTRVQLAVHIEDGSRGGAELAVTGVPEVSQNVIRTRAVVREGGSLLVGGYTVREQTRFRQRIPLLGRIPLVGRVMSTRADRDQSVARYFLITPKILRAGISYRINSGFDDAPLPTPLEDGTDASGAPGVVEEMPAPNGARASRPANGARASRPANGARASRPAVGARASRPATVRGPPGPQRCAGLPARNGAWASRPAKWYAGLPARNESSCQPECGRGRGGPTGPRVPESPSSPRP